MRDLHLEPFIYLGGSIQESSPSLMIVQGLKMPLAYVELDQRTLGHCVGVAGVVYILRSVDESGVLATKVCESSNTIGGRIQRPG